jgi:hypothetical protein
MRFTAETVLDPRRNSGPAALTGAVVPHDRKATPKTGLLLRYGLGFGRRRVIAIAIAVAELPGVA